MNKGQEKFDKVMHEWGQNKLHSSSGELIKHPSMHKQAIAIAFSEAKSVDPKYGMSKGGKVMEEKRKKAEEGVMVVGFYVHEKKWNLQDDWNQLLDGYQMRSDMSVGIRAGEVKDLSDEDVDTLILSIKNFIQENKLDYSEMKKKYNEYVMVNEEPDNIYEPPYAKGGSVRYDNGGGVSEREKLQTRIDRIKKDLANEATVPMLRKNMEIQLPILEKKLAEYKTPAPVYKPEPQVQEKLPEVQEEVKEEKKEKVEESMEEKKKKWSKEFAEEEEKEEKPKKAVGITKEKVVVQKKERQSITGEVKAHIEGKIDGEFEGTIKTEGVAPIHVKEKVSVEVESQPEPEFKQSASPISVPSSSSQGSGKSQRNVSVPTNRKYWLDIEKKYQNKMRNAIGGKHIPYTSRTINNKYRVHVSSQEVLDEIVKMYNLKRAKEKDKPVALSDISGKNAKGGKIWSQKEVKNEESLRSKAKRMGLIKNKEKLSETHFNKLEEQGPKWKKIVAQVKSHKKN